MRPERRDSVGDEIDMYISNDTKRTLLERNRSQVHQPCEQHEFSLPFCFPVRCSPRTVVAFVA